MCCAAVTNTGYISGSKETLSPATAVPPMGLMPPNRRDEEELKATKMRLDQAISKAKQMEIQLSDAKNRLAVSSCGSACPAWRLSMPRY